MAKKQGIFIFLIIFGAVIGLLDSGYLSMLELRGQTGVACDLGGFNCDAVLASRYSKLLGVPLAYWGLAYYLTLFFLAVVYLDLSASGGTVKRASHVRRGGSALGGKNKKILQLIEFWLWSGFAVSLILLYIQAFVLKAFCLYCLISEVVIFILLIGYLAIKFLSRKN